MNKHREGKLYFGIHDSGRVLGQMVTDNSLREVSKAVSDHIEPKVYPEDKREVIDGKDCISVVFKGNNIPYFAFGRAYMRVADEDRQLSAKELEGIMNKNKILWEDDVSIKSVEEVSIKTLKSYIAHANEAKRINFNFSNRNTVLNKLELTKENKLLNAGVVLFCDKNQVEVQVAIFAGTDKLTFLDIRQFQGNIFSLIEQSENYLKEHMKWRVKFGKIEREEIPEVPIDALREILINSLCHRDYANPQPNYIAFYQDRIEISNPVSFPQNFEPEDFIQGTEKSILRNPLIAHTLFLSKDIEKWGSGLKRVYDLCQAAHVKVEFRRDKQGFTVVFYRPKPTIKVEETSLNERQKKAVDYITEKGKITNQEYKEINNLDSDKTAFRDLVKLVSTGIIESHGEKKWRYYTLQKK